MKKVMLVLAILTLFPGVAWAVNGNCSIFRSWQTGDQLTAGDLTTSFTTVGVTNANADCTASHSTSVAALQTTRQPLQVGLNPDLTPSLTGEIQGLRGLLLRLGQAMDSAQVSQWYVPAMRAENHSGGGISAGDVITLDPGAPLANYLGPAATSQDTPGPRITTTTAYAQRGIVGVALEGIAHAAYGRVAFFGIHHIGVSTDVHVGAYLVTSGTAKLAAATRYHASSSQPPAGAFAVALHATAGPQSSSTRHVRALLFGLTPPATNDVINAADHGIRCDGATDDTAAIRSALVKAAHTIGNMSFGNYVDLPAGDCVVSGQLIIQNGVVLRGRGPQQTTLHYTTAIAISTPAVLLGSTNGTALAFNTRLEDLQMNLNHVVNIAVRSDRANENSGLRRVRIRGFITHGALFQDTSSTIYNANWDISDSELWRTANGGTRNTIGIYVNTFSNNGLIRRTSITNSNGTTTSYLANVWVENQAAGGSGIHMKTVNLENGLIGVFLGNNTELMADGLTFSGTDQNISVAIHTSGSVMLRDMLRSAGSYMITDTFTGTTIPVVGSASAGLRVGSYYKSSGTNQALVAQTTANLGTITGASTPILTIHSTASSGAARRTALAMVGNGDGWMFFVDPAGTNNPLQIRHITGGSGLSFGGTGGSALFELRNTGSVYLQNSTESSLYIGGTFGRSATTCTNCLNIFDGTAPVGTLANGVSLYSTAGELRVMDAAGGATLLSPHDHYTREWIFDSVDTTTGRKLRIDMERMMKALDTFLGGGYVHESTVVMP